MKCTKCGNNRFLANQRCYVDIIVDEHGDFLENTGAEGKDGGPTVNVTDSDEPYGPYVCTKCGKTYDSIS